MTIVKIHPFQESQICDTNRAFFILNTEKVEDKNI